KLTLPSSGMTLRVSTLYWQPSDPGDRRDAVAPDIAAPPNRIGDAAMETVRQTIAALRRERNLQGLWEGAGHVNSARVPVKVIDGKLEIPDFEFTCRLRAAGCATGNAQLATRIGDGVLVGVLTAN